jgi:excisionase family DNA binding protein
MNDEKEDLNLPKKSLFSIYEVSEYFGVTDRTIRLWIEHGHLTGEKIVGSVRVSRESIIQCRFKKK